MDDAEAEAVLVALGPQLEWEKHGHYRLADAQGRTYSIVFCAYLSEAQFAYHWYTSNGGGSCAKLFAATEQEAKVACERHHTTGKWE